MKIAVCYIFPLDNLVNEFESHAKIWTGTYLQYQPKIEHEVVVTYCNGMPTAAQKAIFSGLNHTTATYGGGGWDIGAFQAMSLSLEHDIVVFMNARTFFWKPGWLDRLVWARQSRGEGLYGASASFEFCSLWCRSGHGTNPHIRTSCFACNPKILREYPYLIDSREKGFEFESGMWNFANWFEDSGYNVMMVTWDGEYHKADWRKPPNIFRRGDQSNCLIRDRHTSMYETSSREVKLQLEESANLGSSR